MARESTLQTNIKNWILERYPKAQVRVLHGSGFATSGDPDIYACIQGQAVVIETKQVHERARKNQVKRLCDWARAGAIAIETDNLEFVQRILASPEIFWQRRLIVHSQHEAPGDVKTSDVWMTW